MKHYASKTMKTYGGYAGVDGVDVHLHDLYGRLRFYGPWSVV
jgi:hypothetical protein